MTTADKAALLQNGAAYFMAVREMILYARRSIFIAGWDIDSRVELVRGQDADTDPYPTNLGGVISHVIDSHPALEVYLLIWDYSVVFAPERENLPRLNWLLKIPERLHLCLDDTMPIGGSHHQKIVVIDDSIAFCGGLDITNNRWDRVQHYAEDPYRIDPSGKSFDPYHDLQMMVTGDAVLALGELTRERWKTASDVPVPPVSSRHPLWPQNVTPDFNHIRIGIARTVPETAKSGCKDEILECYLHAIADAKDYIYIENQYIASEKITQVLVQQLKLKPGLKVIILSSITPSYGWFETYSMAVGRAFFNSLLNKAGVQERGLILYAVVPSATGGKPLKVHSKLMIIDDRYMQIGSANISNRSMSVDTECDLFIEAGNDEEKRQIAGILHRLMAEYLDSTPEDIKSELQHKCLFEFIQEHINKVPGFKIIKEEIQDKKQLSEFIRPIADPDRPLVDPKYIGFADNGRGSFRSLNNIYKAVILILILLVISSFWQWIPLEDLTSTEEIQPLLENLNQNRFGPAIIMSLYVIGGLVFFPVTIMITITAAVFGPVTGFIYALGGSMLSAITSFLIGAKLNRSFLNSFLQGRQFQRLNRIFSEYGVFSVVFVRMVPVAPFTVVNLIAGMSNIQTRDFLYGTVIGMVPGILMLTLVGDRLRTLWESPSLENYIVTVLAIIAWLLFSFLLQRLINRWRRKN